MFPLKPLFLQQLPAFMRGSLASSVTNAYRSFAQEADQIHHVGQTKRKVNLYLI